MTHDEPNEKPLQSWKEIAAYLERDIRTATRWEKENGLPVRRHGEGKGSSVYAYPSEIEAWRAGHKLARQETEAAIAPAASRRWIWGAAAAAVVAGILLAGPIFNPPNPLADAAARSGAMVARQVWTGKGVDASGSVSPDGRYLAYINWNCGDLMLRDLETGNNSLLKVADCYKDGYVIQARFSPEGERIAYLWENYPKPANAMERSWEIRILNLDRSQQPAGEKTLLDRGRYGLLEWSRDGKKLLVTAAMHDTIRIALASVETGELQPLKTLDWNDPNPYLSPDTRYIAYDLRQEGGTGNRDIRVLATDGSFDASLIEHPAHDRVVAWDPEGSRLFFVSDRAGDASLYSLLVENGRAAGSPVLVKHGVGEILPLGLTSNGRLFYGAPVSQREVYLADLARVRDTGYSPEPLRTSFRGEQLNPAFSPDGRCLAYLVVEPQSESSSLSTMNSTQLVIRELDSGVERSFGQETTGVRLAGYTPMFFSPDSRRILAIAYDQAKNRRFVASIEADTGKVHPIRIMGEAEQIYPSGWIDDRSVLVRMQVPREENGKTDMRAVLFALDVESGELSDVFMRGMIRWPGAISPSRREAVFAEAVEWRDESSLQLTAIPLGNGQPKALLPLTQRDLPIFSLNFSPDGQVLYFTKRGAELWRVPFMGGKAEPVGLNIEEGNIRTLTLHPNGRRIAFQAGRPQKEIWALENFLGSTTD